MKKITFTKKALALFLAIAMVFTGLYIPKSNVRIVNAEEETEAIEEPKTESVEVMPVAEEAEGIVGTTDDPANAEARIGDAYFTTFAQAVSAARDASGNVTVTLLKDVTVSSGTQIASKSQKTITYDGDGKQRTITTSVKNAMTVGNTGSKVIFQNIKLNHTTEQATVYMSKSATLELKNVDILVKDITNYQYGLISLFGTTDTDTDNTKEEMTLNMEDVTITMDNVGVKDKNSEINALIRTGNGGDTNDKIVRFNMKNCTLDASTSSGVHAILTPSTTDCYATMEDCTFSTYDTIPLQFNGPVESMDKTRCSVSIETTNNLRHYNASNKKELFTATYTAAGAVPVAQVGKTLYADLASAVAAAGEGKIVELLSDVTLGTQANSTSSTDATARTGQITIGKGITIDGNQHKITTYAKHSIKVNYAGAVALRNIEFDCYQQQSLIQVSKAAKLTARDLQINTNSTNTTYYQYGIIAVPATGTGIELNLTRVNVDMTTGGYGADNHAVVRTGNNTDEAKSVAINVTDCNWNLTGADDRIGIMIMQTTTATIVLDNSEIQTLNAVPIYVNAASTGTTIEKKNGTKLSSKNLVAQIGNKGYTSLAGAVSAAKTSTTNVTIELLNNITVSNTVNILNDNSVNTTFDGNGYTITTSGSGNIFIIKGTPNGSGTYEFKDMNVTHQAAGVLFQLNEEKDDTDAVTHTSKKATLKLTNLDVVNANNGGKNWGLITTVPYGADSNIHLDLDDVDVTLTFTVSVVNNGAAVIRTGGDQERNIAIDLNKCNFNVQDAALEEGNKTIYGIYVTGKTDANISLTDSNITTKSFAPIQANSNAGTESTVTIIGDCKLDSTVATYKATPIQGYDAQVGNKVYRTFATAIAEAGAGATIEVLQDLSTGWRDITKSMTIDGNGYEITSTAGDANNKFLFVVKDDATEFKLKDLDIKHLRRGMVVRTDIPTTVTLENVDIDATEAPVSTEYALFNLTAEGTTNLIWNDVTVDMDATTAGSDDNPAIIRTGNDGTKTVNITLTDCNLNTEGAAGRHGIVIMSGAIATLNLTGTTITTLDVVPIKDNTGNATINTTDCTLTYTGIEAIIGDNLYKTFAEALEAANESKTDVTLEILKDISIGAGNTLANENGKSITIEGHNHVLTATGGQHTFMITTTQAGTVEFKNMTIEHQNKGSAVQIAESITGEKITVKLTDVTINATESTEGYDHAIINVLNENTTDLVMTDVTITMSTELDGSDVSPYWGIIRTGNSADKTVNMTLTDCTLDASGAKDRHGIVVISKTTANIVLQNTTIKSGNVAPIKNHATTSQTIELTNCTFDSTTEAYKTAPIEGYEAQVDDVVYCKFSDALTAANQAKESVTLKLLAEITVNQNVYIGNENGKAITFDGNGKDVTTAGKSNNHAFRINKDCTVGFKNMTVYHKNMGSFIQVESDLKEVTLSLANVTINANNPDNTSVSATVGNYNYALINVFSSATVNLTDVTVDMDVTQNGKDYPGIVRTGNHNDAEKTVTINVNGGNWNTEGATGRHGIVIMKTTNAKVNLVGATITTADAAPIADYSQKAVITRDEETATTCSGNYEAYVLGINNKPTHTPYATFAEALKAANEFAGDATLGLLKDVSVGAKDSGNGIGNANGKLIVEGNTNTITTENGNHAFTVNKNKEVEFQNLTIAHKGYGAAIQVNAAGATLSLTNVFLDAKYASELTNAGKTYNYALINLLTSSTLNMTNSRAIMIVDALGAGSGNQSSIIRTGNQDTDKDEAVYKEITINLTDCILDTTSATNRSGILVVDAKTDINLKGITKILTQAGDKCAAIRGLEGTRVAKISMEETCLLQTGESTAYADVIKNVEERITDACTWTYKQYNNLSAFRTESGLKAPTTVPTGYVFAGWYSDKACTAEYALAADDITTTSAYAKFVPDHVIDVKAQLSVNLLDGLTDGEKGAIRFVTTVDSLDYTEVGFDYIIQISDTVSKTGTVSSSTVYKTLYAVGDKTSEPISYTPDEAFCGVSQYFKAITIKNIPQSAFGAEITVTPFWVTLEGTKVYGEPATKTVNQGIKAADSEGNVTEDSENTGSVYTNRVVMVSDLHYTTSLEKEIYDKENWSFGAWLSKKLPNASWAAGNAFGYTQEQKLQAALDDINAFGAKNTLDAVMVLGDLTLDDYGYRNLVDNYLDDFKLNFMDKLSPSYATYAIAGNHDSYTNAEWKNTIGTDRQYSVVIGDAVFIMLDTFAAQHATGGNGSAYVGVDIDFLRTELQKAEYVDKTIFLCSHYYQQGENPENDTALNALIANDDRVVCMFRAHTHKNVVGTPSALAGSPLVDIGGYAYNGQQEDDGSYEFNTFDKSWAWGYQVVEWNESEVHIYHVKSARKYTDCNGIEHNYKGAIEGDMVIKIGE